MSTEITLRLPDSVIRKIRAYNILVGGDAKNFESMLVSMIESTVSSQIMVAVGVQEATTSIVGRPGAKKLHRLVEETPLFHDDVSGISSGLGDDDDTPIEEQSASAEAGMEDPYLSENSRGGGGGGLTDEELATDMSVADPKHEAKADSKTFADSINEESPEGLFAQVAGLPKPVEDHRVTKRNHAKTVGGRRARVRPMMENEE